MKKNYLLCVCLFFSGIVNAQITITSAEMPVPGYLPRFTIPDSISTLGIDFTTTGANATWDYTYLQPNVQRVDTFISVPIQYQLSFTGATVARPLPVGGPGGGGMPGGVTIQSGYEFFRKSNSKYERMGYGGTVSGSPFPLSLVNNPKDIVYNFPLNFGDQDTSYSTAILDVSGFVYIEQHQTRINHVDGWGSIATPYKQFQALRVRTEITGFDSIVYSGFNIAQPRNPSVNYKWLANGEKVPVMQINTSEFFGSETPQSIVYRDTIRNVPTLGILPSVQPIGGKLYPNPASSSIQVAWETSIGDAMLEVLTPEGKCVLSVEVNSLRQIFIDVSDLATGIYFVRVFGEGKQFNGTLTISQK